MSRRSRKSVRFNLPSDHAEQPPSILRRQTRGNLELDYQPTLTRRASLPTSVMSTASRIRGIEALHGLRDYIKDACNFHGEQYRRALSVPSVNTLCQLTNYIASLRGDSRSITTADERVLHRVLDCSKSHPHEQLSQPDQLTSRHARNAIRAHRKRARREADFHLLQFTARQLKFPARALKELSSKQRHIREVEAFKERILKFYGPNQGGTTSAPQSPAGRPLTAPRSPATDPIRWEHTHGALSGTPYDLFPEQMEQLALPATHDSRMYPSGRPHVPPTPPQRLATSPYIQVPTQPTPPQRLATSPYMQVPTQPTPPQRLATSPYMQVPTQPTPPQRLATSPYMQVPTQPTPPQRLATSPYIPVQTPPQHYQPSPYLYSGGPAGGYQRTPPQPPVSMPYGTAYPQQYVSNAQAFAPQPMSLPQAINTPQQGVQPIAAIPPPMPGRTSAPHTPLQTTLPTPHTPQQQPLPVPHTPQQQPHQPLQHPTPGSTGPATPQQSLPPTPMQHVLPASQQHVPIQPSQVPAMQQVPVQQVPVQQVPIQHVPVSGSFVLPVPTAVPTVLPTVQYPQQFPGQQPQQPMQPQNYPAGYQQHQYTQYAQGYQNRDGKQQKG